METKADARFGSVTDLGKLRKTYRHRAEIADWTPIGCVAALGAAAAFIAYPSEFRRLLPILLPAAALLLGLAIAVERGLRREALVIYERGFALYKGQKLTEVKWEDVAWLDDKRPEPGTEPPFFCYVHTRQNQTIEIPLIFEGSGELRTAIKSGVHQSRRRG